MKLLPSPWRKLRAGLYTRGSEATALRLPGYASWVLLCPGKPPRRFSTLRDAVEQYEQGKTLEKLLEGVRTP